MEGPTAAPFDFFSPLSSPGFSLQFCLLLFSFFLLLSLVWSLVIFLFFFLLLSLCSVFNSCFFFFFSFFFHWFGLQFFLLLFFFFFHWVQSLQKTGSIEGLYPRFKNTTIDPKNATIGYSDVSYSRIYKPGLYYAAIAPYKSIATFLQPWLKVKPIAAVKHCLTAAIGFGPIAAFLKNAATGPL